LAIAIFPGTFDPVTTGHLNIIERAGKMSIGDKLIVLVADNEMKKPMFSLSERMDLIREATSGFSFVEVDYFGGLVAHYAKIKKASIIIRGVRNITDYGYEVEMAHFNSQLCPGLETLFLPAKLNHAFISSRAVKEIARGGGAVAGLVPDYIEERIRSKIGDIC
jgi:pantetheine-phosphate adenylyltransferase